MTTVLIDGLDNRTTSETVKIFCQNFGRILNCYTRLNQCTVTFADKHQAEEFIRASPHRIGSNGPVNAVLKTSFHRDFTSSSSSSSQRSTTTNLNDNFRLTIRGTSEQLEQQNLLRYFSRYGSVRMCLPNLSQGTATLTYDDRSSYERALKESKHFLNGRSLIVEPYTFEEELESNKRMKYAEPNPSFLTSRFEQEKEQLINDQIRFQQQLHERIQLHEYEKQQWNIYIATQQNEFQQQISHYQYLLKQSLDELTTKDKQIEQLKQENKDIDDLLRQSVHDNEQQQIHLRKREDIHNQTKRKYEELYKAYMKLKDNCPDKEKDSINPKSSNSIPKSSIDNVKKKL